MFWIINDNVKFTPENKAIVSLINPELSAVLTTPASRCFEILLESYPEVVSHKDIFDYVWGDAGASVPLNTLYQNISIIRRGLAETSENRDSVIITVPRKGFQIGGNTKVTRSSVDENSTSSIQETAVSNEPTGAEHTASVADESHKKSKNTRYTFQYRRFGIKPVNILIAMALTIVAVVFFHLQWHENAKNFFDDYKLQQVENGCHYISKNEGISDHNNFEKFKNIIKNTGVDCKRYPWIYFSSSMSTPVVTALLCKDPYEDISSTDCTTLIIRGVIRD